MIIYSYEELLFKLENLYEIYYNTLSFKHRDEVKDKINSIKKEFLRRSNQDNKIRIFNFDEMPKDIQEDIIYQKFSWAIRFDRYTEYNISLKISSEYNILPKYLIKNGCFDGEKILIKNIHRDD